VVTRRIAWDGEDDWVSIADNARTALTDDNLAWTASSKSFRLNARRAAGVMDRQETGASGRDRDPG
jgi:hypothetical protein